MSVRLDASFSVTIWTICSIDWLSGLSDQKELKPEINNYKDFAVRILELLELDVFPYLIYIKKEKKDNKFMQSLILPESHELFNFMDTYADLCNLLNNGIIKQHVMDTWLTGALEELKAIPIKRPIEEISEEHSNVPNELPKGNPLMSILNPDIPSGE